MLFRRWTAPKSIHFYVFCLASFVLYSFRSTGELGIYDWGNMVAQALQPALFLHFAVSFSDNYASEQRNRFKRRLVCALLYVPGVFLLGLQYTAIRFWSATEILLHRLDQIRLGYLALYYVIAAVVFRFAVSPGRVCAGAPATEVADPRNSAGGGAVHAAVRDSLSCGLAVPGSLAKLAGLSLVMLPLTFSWAIVRYRLMDVDLIFKRGVTYTLATASLVGFTSAWCGHRRDRAQRDSPAVGCLGPDVRPSLSPGSSSIR